MIDIPDMPKDWWPDMMIVRGDLRHNGKQLSLSFAMTDEIAKYPHVWQTHLDRLRLMLWQAPYDSEIMEIAS